MTDTHQSRFLEAPFVRMLRTRSTSLKRTNLRLVCFASYYQVGKSTTQEFVSPLPIGPELKLGPTFSLQCAFGCQLESENTKLSKTWLLLLDQMVYLLLVLQWLWQCTTETKFLYQEPEPKLILVSKIGAETFFAEFLMFSYFFGEYKF